MVVKESTSLVKDLVSVLTPAYNAQEYLGHLLDSILSQTYSHIEMIVIDDGSSDATFQIAQSYTSKFEERGYRLLVLSTPHKNASAAINAALPYVQGEYLVWPDSDDELFPDSISLRVNFLKKYPQYQCVRSLMEYRSYLTKERINTGEQLGNLEKEKIFWDVLEGKSFVCCGCYMLKTKPFFKIYPQRKIFESDAGQNFQMLLPFLFQYQCPTIPQKLYRVYIRPLSNSRKLHLEKEKLQLAWQFEKLIDEIVKVCGIQNKSSLCRIKLWKVRRKAWLAYEYHHPFQLLKYGTTILFLKVKYNLLVLNEKTKEE